MKRGRKTYRLAQRRHSKRARGRRILKAIEICVCVGIVGAFTYEFLEYVDGSTDFQVQKVKFLGLNYLNERDVLAASGITSDGNILFFDSDDVVRRVESMPYVRSCEVSLVFPETVVLTIQEREPAATLMINSRSYAIDEERVVLRPYGPTEMPMPPYFTEVEGLEIVEEGELLSHPGLRRAMEVWQCFARSPIGKELTVSELAVYGPNEILMYCDELEYEMRWGRGDIEDQVLRLNALWDELDGRLGCTKYLDLRFDSDLACK